MTKSNVERFILVAADSLAELRKSDVYRVLSECPVCHRDALAAHIETNRAELAEEVALSMGEMTE